MHGFHLHRRIKVASDRHATSRAAGRNHLGFRCVDVVDLAFGDLRRDLRMLHLERPAATAAVVGPGHFHILHIRN